jgi:HPt (histidine-containing phosphotransfer) domain-containing protein
MSASERQDATSYISRAELLNEFDGDVRFVTEIVSMFLRRYPQLIAEIRHALGSSDAGAISRAAHSLKGSVGYFDRGQVYAVSEKIERITAADLTRVPDLVQDLEHVLGKLAAYLEAQFLAAI